MVLQLVALAGLLIEGLIAVHSAHGQKELRDDCRVELAGIDDTRPATLLDLLPRKPPACYSDDELEEFERRLWINFSHAFAAPGDVPALSPRKLEELPELLHPLGFEEVWLERKRFVMLNVELVDPEPPRLDDEVHFFGFCKTGGAAQARFRDLRTALLRRDPEIWERRLSTVPGKEVSLSVRRSFAESQDRSQTELRVGPFPMPIPGEYADLLAGFLAHVDGRTTLHALFDALRSNQPDLDEDVFLELVYCLTVERYLVDLTGIQDSPAI